MICRRAVRLICLDAGGNLELRRQSALAEHLAACAPCRDFRGELEEALAAARSWELPQLQAGSGDLRRSVWREISKERARERPFGVPGVRSLITAAAAACAALVVAALLSRRPVAQSGRVVPLPSPPPIASRVVSPSSESTPSDPPVGYVGALSSPRRVDSDGSGITRIEFRTPDPQVRIIWLLGREASEPSRVPPTGPKQEVS